MSELAVRAYESNDERAWNDLIRASRTPHFMLERGYMEYHADRFTDASVVVFDGQVMVAALPASSHGAEVVSHGGLTFGGLVCSSRFGAARTLQVFAAIAEALAQRGFESLRYKAIPHIYHTHPAEEDLYALFRHEARLARRDISCTIDLSDRLRFSKGRRWSLKRADRSLVISESDDFAAFMDVEREALERHAAAATHTALELRLLHERFPSSIRLFAAHRGTDMLAGIVVYETPRAVHTQYIGATAEGKQVGAVDLLVEHLVNLYGSSHRWFDFGISTERQGTYLNVGLAGNKESYGGRGTVYDQYEVPLVRRPEGIDATA